MTQIKPQSSDRFFVLKRLVLMLVSFLLLGLVFYVLHNQFNLPGEGVTITLSILFILPFSIGALSAYVWRLVEDTAVRPGWVAVLVNLFVLIVGAIVLREGVICVVMLMPFWIFASLFGASMTAIFARTIDDRRRLNCSMLLFLPVFSMSVEAHLPPSASQYVVARERVIAASPAEIWPHLLQMEAIADHEGIWTVTQNLLGVPRPRAAVVIGEGVGAIRDARWGDTVSFEEHLIGWELERSLRWVFVFPNDSVHKHTDEHIAPDGVHLKIGEGGYTIEPLGGGRTKLTLFTTYEARTPVNAYSRLWGELILGDIQNNILHIVEDRAKGKTGS